MSSSLSYWWTDPRLIDFPGVAVVVLEVYNYSLVPVSAVQRCDSLLCAYDEGFRSVSVTGEQDMGSHSL